MLNYFTNHLEIISGIITFIGGFFQFLYCRSEKFFLFINKIYLNFKKYKLSVYLNIEISLTSKLDVDSFKNMLKKIELSNSEYINFEIKTNTIAYNETKILVLIRYRSFLAKIEDDKEVIREKINKIKETTNSQVTNINIDLKFDKDKNPYQGLFIKKLPIEKIQDFSVKLKINNSLIEAKKDKIKIRSINLDKALFTLSNIINLKLAIFDR